MLIEDFDFDETPKRKFALRDYQVRCLDAIDEAFKKYCRILVDMATGTGKTSLFAVAAAKVVAKGGKVLVIENRDALVAQTAKRIREETGVEVDIEKAEMRGSPLSPIIVASVQTLCRTNRLLNWPDSHFDLLIVDECFPCSTQVDGRNISTIKTGDLVKCYDHLSSSITTKEVIHAFKRPVSALVKILLSNGRSLICTPKHPIYTQRGYQPAEQLLPSDTVYECLQMLPMRDAPDEDRILQQESATRDILRPMQDRAQKGANEVFNIGVQELREASTMLRKKNIAYVIGCGEVQPGLLLSGLRGCGDETLKKRNASRGIQQDIWSSENEGKQPNEEPRSKGANAQKTDRENILIEGREWSAYETTGCPVVRIGLVDRCDGVSNSNCISEKSIQKPPKLLQGGFSRALFETRHRSGRQNAPTQEMEIFRREKNGCLVGVRVDYVEILERGGGHGFEQVCPDGFVYNLEVEEHNNYFANGILVHNCHHSLAESYQKVLGYFHYGKQSLEEGWEAPDPESDYIHNANILSVTATPDLGNRRSLGEFYEHVAFQYQLIQAVNDGWLCRPITKNIPLKIDIRGLRPGRTPNGSDFKPEELSAKMVPIIDALAQQIAAVAPDRKGIAFVPSIECARLLAEALNRHGMNGIFVSGACLDVDEKTQAFRDAGPGTVLCNAALYVEGADFPDISCVICARATKSKGFYRQQVGRGTRVLPGVVDGLQSPEERKLAIACSAKPDLLVLDPLWISDRIDLCDAYDLFTDDAGVKAKMKETGLEGMDLADLSAAAERDFIAALEKEARKHAKKQARTIDPLALSVSLGDIAEWKPESQADLRPPSAGQLDFLRKRGVDTTNIKYAGLASKMISRLITRLQLKLATVHQLSLMRQLGLDEKTCATLSIRDASALIDATIEAKRSRS